MAESLEFRVNVTRGSTEGLDALQRHLNELLGPGTRAGFRRQLNIAANIEPGSTAGLEAAVRRAHEVSQQTMLRVARQAEPGTTPALQGLLATALEARRSQAARLQPQPPGLTSAWRPGTAGLPFVTPAPAAPFSAWRPPPGPLAGWRVGPGGGLQRVGSTGTGGTGAYGMQEITGMPAFVPPPMQPWPPNLPRSPFGPGAGGPQGPPLPPTVYPPPPGLPPPTPPTPPPGAPAPAGPYSPWWAPGTPGAGFGWANALTRGGGGGAGGGTGAGAGGGPSMWSTAAGFAGRIPGLALGYGVARALGTAMESYEERFRGVLQVGSVLQGQYEDVNQTILRLRENYQILTRDAVLGLTKVARATGEVGTTLGVGPAMQVGRAYGFEREAPDILTTLALMSTTRQPNLAAITGLYNQQVRGRAPLSAARFAEEVAAVSQVGGFGAAPLDPEQYASYTAYMTRFGGKYAAQPAAAYAERFAGMQAPASPLGEAMRMMAIGDIRARQGFVELGGQRINLGTATGLRIAQEQAAQIPEVEAAIFERIRQQGGMSQDMRIALLQEALNIPTAYGALQQSQAMETMRNEPGGLVGALRRRADMGLEAETITKALARQREEAPQGTGLRQRDVDRERLDEAAFIDAFQQMQNKVAAGVSQMVEDWNRTHEPIMTAIDAVKALGREVWAAVAVLLMTKGGIPGLIVGGTIAGGIAGADLLDRLNAPPSPPGAFQPETPSLNPVQPFQ